MVAPRWLSMKNPTDSMTQNSVAAPKPIRMPMKVSFKAMARPAIIVNSAVGAPSAMTGKMNRSRLAAKLLRTIPGRICLLNIGNMANTPMIRGRPKVKMRSA